MIRKHGRVKGNVVELLEPGGLQDGMLVELEIHPVGETEDWHSLGMSRLVAEWDNPEDAVYDDWKRLYGVQEGDVVLGAISLSGPFGRENSACCGSVE